MDNNKSLKYTIENDGKKKGIVEIKKTFLSIGENTLNIFRNLLNDSNFKEPQYLTFLERVINYYWRFIKNLAWET